MTKLNTLQNESSKHRIRKKSIGYMDIVDTKGFFPLELSTLYV